MYCSDSTNLLEYGKFDMFSLECCQHLNWRLYVENYYEGISRYKLAITYAL